MNLVIRTLKWTLRCVGDGVAKISGLFNFKVSELVSKFKKELVQNGFLLFVALCFAVLSTALFIMFAGSEPTTFVHRLLSSDGREPEIVSYLRHLEWFLLPLWLILLSLLLYLLYVEQFKILVSLASFCFFLVSAAQLVIFCAKDGDNFIDEWLAPDGNAPEFYFHLANLDWTLQNCWLILFVFLFYARCREYYENPEFEWLRSAISNFLVSYSTLIIVIVLSLSTLVWDFVWVLIEDPKVRQFFLNFYIDNYRFFCVLQSMFVSLF